MRESLTKKERIRSKSDFKQLFSSSETVGCRGAKLFFLENNLDNSRFGVTLRKKYGNAVERNRARRILKEIYRTHKSLIIGSYDILIILYPGEYDFKERLEQFLFLIKRAKIVKVD